MKICKWCYCFEWVPNQFLSVEWHLSITDWVRIHHNIGNVYKHWVFKQFSQIYLSSTSTISTSIWHQRLNSSDTTSNICNEYIFTFPTKLKVMFSQVFVCPLGGGVVGQTTLEADPPPSGGRPKAFTPHPWKEYWTRQEVTSYPYPPPRNNKNGRYATYWNAFLLRLRLLVVIVPQYNTAPGRKKKRSTKSLWNL